MRGRGLITDLAEWLLGRIGNLSLQMRTARYLSFDNIDMREPEIVSHCSQCGLEFKSAPKPGEHIDEVLMRIRVEYDAHLCCASTFLQ